MFIEQINFKNHTKWNIKYPSILTEDLRQCDKQGGLKRVKILGLKYSLHHLHVTLNKILNTPSFLISTMKLIMKSGGYWGHSVNRYTENILKSSDSINNNDSISVSYHYYYFRLKYKKNVMFIYITFLFNIFKSSYFFVRIITFNYINRKLIFFTK